MAEQVPEAHTLWQIILLLGIFFLGFRIMLGRAFIPVVILCLLALSQDLFPGDPLARFLGGPVLQVVLPLFLLWGLWRFFFRTMVEPERHGRRR